jgi:hypothetical protein
LAPESASPFAALLWQEMAIKKTLSVLNTPNVGEDNLLSGLFICWKKGTNELRLVT